MRRVLAPATWATRWSERCARRYVARRPASAGRTLETSRGRHRPPLSGGANVWSDDPRDPRATHFSDLRAPGSLPERAFDLVVVTDARVLTPEALPTLIAAVAPGGVLVVAVPRGDADALTSAVRRVDPQAEVIVRGGAVCACLTPPPP